MKKIVDVAASLMPAISYADALGYSTLLTNVQIWLGILGTLGWFGGQWCAISTVFGMLALTSYEMNSKNIMKYVCVSILPLAICDIIWMSTYAKEAHSVRTKWTLACVIFLFFMRIPQFFVWSKMWSTDFGENDAFDGQQQQQQHGGQVGGTQTQQQQQQQFSSPGVGVRLDDVQTETPNQRDPNAPPPYQPPNEFA